MGTTNARAGSYGPKIVSLQLKWRAPFPSITDVRDHWSQFGSILTIYYLDNSRINKPDKLDHIYIVYEKDDSVASVKGQWSKRSADDFWKGSFQIGYFRKTCPGVLMAHIQYVCGGGPESWSHLSRPKRETEELGPKLRSSKRKITESEQSDQGSVQGQSNKRTKIESPKPTPPSHKCSCTQDIPSSTLAEKPDPGGTPPSCALAESRTDMPNGSYPDGGTDLPIPVQEGIEVNPIATSPSTQDLLMLSSEAERLRNELRDMKTQRDRVKLERDQLRAERDDARAEGDRYRVERDSARVEYEKYRAELDRMVEKDEKASEAGRELRKQVEELKKVLKERSTVSRKVVQLMVDSLQDGLGSEP